MNRTPGAILPVLPISLLRRCVAEGIGTALLLATVVGSGIMADRLAGGNVAVALLANALATGGGLVALILTFGPISGAHFNPVVTLTTACQGETSWKHVPPYLAAQFSGAIFGVVVAHVMFGEPWLALARHPRAGGAQIGSEFVATFGLLSVIISCGRHRPDAAPFAIAAYITGAYWFTASTSFANPAATIARALTDTFAGIRAQDAPAFMAAQMAGAAAALGLFGWLLAGAKDVAVADHGAVTAAAMIARKEKA